MDEKQLDRAFEELPAMPLAVSERIREQIRRDTQPARPLMSNAAYVLAFCCIFAVVSFLFAAAIGFNAWHIAPETVAIMLVVIVLLAAWSGWMVAGTMRPGSGRVFGLLAAVIAFAAYETLVLTSFSSYSMTLFVHRGVTCLALGVACAALASLPIWLVVRRGFAVQPMTSGALIGLLSGLAGLAALTLHCPIFEVPHAGVWHGAVILVCIPAGMLASGVLKRR